MTTRANVLIVMGDQWRRNSIGCMGQDPVVTPHMDQLAADGTLCTGAYSCSPLCTLTPPGERRLGFRFWHSNGCVHDHFRCTYLNTAGELIDQPGWQVDHETDVAIDYIRNQNGQRPTDKTRLMWLSWAPPHNGDASENHDPNDPRYGDGHRYFAPVEDEALYAGELPIWHPDTDEEPLSASGSRSLRLHQFDGPQPGATHGLPRGAGHRR